MVADVLIGIPYERVAGVPKYQADPAKRQPLPRRLLARLAQAHHTRIGGPPLFLQKALAPTLDQLACPLCTATMTFLLQVYSPIDDEHHRLLHVFACLGAGCQKAASPGAWRVFRSQIPLADFRLPAEATPTPLAAKPRAAPLFAMDDDWGVGDKDAWGAAGDTGSPGAADKDAWGVGDTDAWGTAGNKDAWGGSNDAAPAPTNNKNAWATDNSKVTGWPAGAAASLAPGASGLEAFVSLDHPYVTQCHILDGVAEQQTGLLDSSDDEADALPPGRALGSLTKHEQELLRQYEAEHGSIDKLLASVEKKAAKSAAAATAAAAAAPPGPDTAGDEKGSITEAQASWVGEQYEVQSFRGVDDSLVRFQAAVAAYPGQSIRYSNGIDGRPLAFSDDPALSPASGSEQSPRCANCGGVSVFEVQLMPALISQLDLCGNRLLTPTDAAAAQQAAAAPGQAPGGPLPAALAEALGIATTSSGGGAPARPKQQQQQQQQQLLDFGTVLVYSCLDNCDPSLTHDMPTHSLAGPAVLVHPDLY